MTVLLFFMGPNLLFQSPLLLPFLVMEFIYFALPSFAAFLLVERESCAPILYHNYRCLF